MKGDGNLNKTEESLFNLRNLFLFLFKEDKREKNYNQIVDCSK